MARQQKSISEWLNSQGEKCHGVRVQLGTRAAGQTVGIVGIEGRALAIGDEVPYTSTWEDLPRTIEDLALSAGWGAGLGQESTLRLYSISAAGKSLTTYQRTAAPERSQSGGVSAVHALAMEHRRTTDQMLQTICEQARIQTRTIDLLSETLAHRENLLAGCLESFLDAQQEAIEQRAANVMLEQALNEGEEQSGLKSMQEQVLSGVIGLIGGGAADGDGDEENELSADEIYKAMQSNPFLKFDLQKMFDADQQTKAEGKGPETA